MVKEDQKKENGATDVSMTDANAPLKPDPKKDLLKNGKKPDNADDELTEEDRALKENLELLVTRAVDKDPGVQKLALESIRTEIRSATSSMTSVPKPLKFLRDHFLPLKQHYAKMDDAALKDNKQFLADILSVLAMTMGDDENCESLRYKLLGSDEAPHLWGHEYVRHLAGEIGREFNELLLSDSMSDDPSTETTPPKALELNADGTVKLPRATDKSLLEIIDDIVPFLISSNAEPEAVDLLIEVDALRKLPSLADKHNYSRVCLYLKACADFTKESDALLSVAIDIYVKVDKLPEAMQVALRRGHIDQITRLYKMSRPQSAERMQLAFDLAAANILVDEDVESDDTYREVMSNRKRTEYFKHLAKDLDVLEPKVPEDIYKSHLIDSRAAAPANNDSARANLASTYVNAFVNMGFGKDKLMADTESSWIYRNKEHGMMAAAASLGMIGLWDDDTGLGELDKYLYSDQEHVKAGALLGIGLLFAGIRNDVEPAMALLVEQLHADKTSVRNGVVAGLAIAYAGTCKEEVKDALIPILLDLDASPDTVALAALALGLVYVGSADEDLCSTMIENLAERKNSPAVNSEPMLAIFLPLGLGLLFLGKQEAIEATEETLPALVGNDCLLGRIALITLTACAYCGTGDIEQVQNFLTICSEHPSVSEESENAAEAMQTPPAETSNASPAEGSADPNAATPAATTATTAAPAAAAAPAATATPVASAATNGASETATSNDLASEQERVRIATAEQSVAVLGLAMVSMGEELGADMSVRTFGHLLQYGDSQIRRMVPLALGLLSVSNPKLSLMDLLSKFTHDSDMDVAQASILALGLIGAGTNNSRIAGILRQLTSYYSKEPSTLFLVRISQGLLHSAKGLVTLNPHYGDSKFVLSNCAMGGIITVLFSCLDMKATITGKNHFLIYFLALAARPRMVFTVNKELEFVKTSVRVGNAVDTVGQAGRPKSITGFQTHTTPVLIGGGERAELATEQYISLAAAMEGVVVVEKNPEWEDESGLEAAAAAMDTTTTAEEGSAKKEEVKEEIVD